MLIDNHVHLHGQPYSLTTIEQYVAAARSRGVEEICLVEHGTVFRSWWERLGEWWVDLGPPAMEKYCANTFWPTQGYRDTAEFIRLIGAARRKGLPVTAGVELDYIEGQENTLRELVAATPWDVVIGSVHTIGAWPFNHYGCREAWDRCDVDAAYRRYFDLLDKLIRSRLCDVIGHPDLIKLFGHRPSFGLMRTYRCIAEVARTADVAVEANAMGWDSVCGEMYPCEEFLDQLRRAEAPFSLASDAHKPEDAGKGLRHVRRVLRKSGVARVCRFRGRARSATSL